MKRRRPTPKSNKKTDWLPAIDGWKGSNNDGYSENRPMQFHPYESKRRADRSELESKMQLLPQLQNVEYIQLQLERRGAAKLDMNTIQASMFDQNFTLSDTIVPLTNNSAERDIQYEIRAKLHKKFPRFCDNLIEQRVSEARPQSLHWVVQIIESVYEARQRAISRINANVSGSTQTLKPFPHFVYEHLQQTFGVSDLAGLNAWNLLVSLDSFICTWPKQKLLDFYGVTLQIFSDFLAEVMDDDVLMLYLLCRRSMEFSTKTHLHLENKPMTQEHRVVGAFIVKRTCMLDELWLNKNACLETGRVLLKQLGIEDRDMARFQKYFLKMVVLRFEKIRKKDLAEAENDIFKPIDLSKFLISSAHFLAHVVSHFKQIPHDIIKDIKYLDDGSRLQMIDMLRGTANTAATIGDVQKELDSQLVELKGLKTEVLRLEKKLLRDETTPIQTKTALVLAKGSVAQKEIQVQGTKARLAKLQDQESSIWNGIMARSSIDVPQKLATKASNSIGDVPQRMYAAWIRREIDAPEEVLELGGAVPYEEELKQQLDEIRRDTFVNKFANKPAPPPISELKTQEWKRPLALSEPFRAQPPLTSVPQYVMPAQVSKSTDTGTDGIITELPQFQTTATPNVSQLTRILTKRPPEKVIASKNHNANMKLLGYYLVEWGLRVKFLKIRKSHDERTKKITIRRWITQKRNIDRIRGKRDKAASLIQGWIRCRQSKKLLALLKEKQHQIELKIKSNLYCLMNRNVSRALHAWREYAQRMVRVRGFIQENMSSLQKRYFETWQTNAKESRVAKVNAVTKIQCAHRLWYAKRYATHRKLTIKSARMIQGAWRSYTARHVLNHARAYQKKQERLVVSSIRKIQYKYVAQCFEALALYSKKAQASRKLLDTLTKRHRLEIFTSWAALALPAHTRKKAAAIQIQSKFRGFSASRAFTEFRKKYNAARMIQMQVRCHMAKTVVTRMILERQAAIAIQKIYRGYVGRAFFRKILGDFLFENTVPNAYVAIQNTIVRCNVDITVLREAESGNTMLHVAAISGAKRIIKMCLRQGLDVNVVNAANRTPLHELARSVCTNQPNIAEYLVKHGANPNCQDVSGFTPLMESVEHENFQMVRFLASCSDLEIRDFEDEMTVLYQACRADAVDSVRILLTAGASMMTKTSDGKTPMHECATLDHVDSLEALLQVGSTAEFVEVRDSMGRTPLHYAVTSGSVDSAKLLLQYNATLGAADAYGRIPLWYAAGAGQLQCVRLLLNNDSPVDNACSDTGNTPLHCACLHAQQSESQVEEAKDDDEDGSVSNSHVEIVRQLLLNGCWPNIQNRQGDLAIHIACRTNIVDLVRCLVYYDCDMNKKNYGGQTPLGAARIVGAKDVEKYILDTFIFQEVSASKKQSKTDPSLDLSEKEWKQLLKKFSTLEREVGKSTKTPCSQYRIIKVPRSNERFFPLNYKTFWVNTAENAFYWELPEKLEEFFNAHEGGNAQFAEAESNAPRKILVKRVAKNTGDDKDGGIQMTANDYQAFWEQENEDFFMYMKEEKAATRMQTFVRVFLAKCLLRRMRIWLKSAIRIQKYWRRFVFTRVVFQVIAQHRGATKMQKLWRAYRTREWFYKAKAVILHERAVEKCAVTSQRLTRGCQARKLARIKFAAEVSPAPKTKQDWQLLVGASFFLKRFRDWNEFLVRQPDVTCYWNSRFDVYQWSKPKAWRDRDMLYMREIWEVLDAGFTLYHLKIARAMQLAYRRRRLRRICHIMVSAVRVMSLAETAYLEEPFNPSSPFDPAAMVRLCNYMVFVHVVDHDLRRAGPLYECALKAMVKRGPDNPFVLFTYACYIAATSTNSFEQVTEYMHRAHKADPSMKSLQFAELGFFRHALMLDPDNPLVWFNSALLLQFRGSSLTPGLEITPDFDEAERHYIKSLKLDSHNQVVVSNFNYFLKNLKHANYDAYEAVKMAQQDEREGIVEEYNEYKESAVRNVQRRVRGYLCRKHVRESVIENWEEYFDESTNKSYFYCKADGRSQWNKPFMFESKTANTHADMDAVVPWIVASTEDGVVFYYNMDTLESEWTLPPGFATLSSGAYGWGAYQAPDGSTYYYNAHTGETRYQDEVIRI